jgi:hypothetical protein
VSLPGQFLGALRLARLGLFDGLARRARRDAGGERDQELGAGPFGRHGRVIRVRRERGDLVGAPHPQRHRGEDAGELAVVGGGEQPERAPLARPQRRPPQPEHVPLRRELAGVRGLARADVSHGLVRCSVRDVGGHGDQVLHSWFLCGWWNHRPFRKKGQWG